MLAKILPHLLSHCDDCVGDFDLFLVVCPCHSTAIMAWMVCIVHLLLNHLFEITIL